MKKLVCTLLACLCIATMTVSVFAAEVESETAPEGYGEILGYEDPNAVGQVIVDPAKDNSMMRATYTYLWDFEVSILSSGSLMTTYYNNKSISSSYTSLQIKGSINSDVTAGACYRNSQAVNVSLGSTTMSSGTRTCNITHQSGYTTNGYIKNNSTKSISNYKWEFSGGK